MKILKILGGTILGIVLVAVVAGFFLPAKSHVERSITIGKPPGQIYGFLVDLRNFNTWSPWHVLDPNTQYDFSGAEMGLGSKMSWSSEDPNVGSGSQEIISLRENELIQINLVFGGEQGGLAYYRLTPVDQGTVVTWEFDTDFGNNIIGRYFGLMMDGMLGPFYEQGLADLKAHLEHQ